MTASPSAFSIDQPYDVAVSFLQRDEPLALQLFNRLSESYRVFVYSKRQEKIAGADGLEVFRKAFLDESRLVVVLYRDDWGKTPWTRIEEQAVQDRFLKEGWSWLLFVSLDSTSTPPPWLPETRIRLNFEEYGFEQLVGAIRARAQELGSVSRRPGIVDRAQRLEREAALRTERERLLSSDGMQAVQGEAQKVFAALTQKADDLALKVPNLGLQFGASRGDCVINTSSAAINLCPYFTHPVTESRLLMHEWPHRMILPQDEGKKVYLIKPRRVNDRSIYFDYRAEYGGWCWTERDTSQRFYSSDELADYCLEILLSLHDRVVRGEIKASISDDWADGN